MHQQHKGENTEKNNKNNNEPGKFSNKWKLSVRDEAWFVKASTHRFSLWKERISNFSPEVFVSGMQSSITTACRQMSVYRGERSIKVITCGICAVSISISIFLILAQLHVILKCPTISLQTLDAIL